jgi:lipoprotein signal peptidase
MLLAVLALLAVLTVPLTGGHLSRLAEVRFRAPALAIGGLALQVLVVSVLPDLPSWAAITLHLVSYVAVLAFIWCNRSLPGLWLIGAGGLSNLVVIAANGGVMPASADALRTAGRSATESGFTNSEAVAHPHLGFLGDVLPLPSWMPFANVFSIGDVLIVVGVFVLVHGICRGRAPASASAAD